MKLPRRGSFTTAWISIVATGLALVLAATPAPAQTWTAPGPLNSTAASAPFVGDSEPQLVSDGQGRWLAVWTRVEGPFSSEGDFVFARSTDDGATWSDPLPLSATPPVTR